MQVAFTPSVYTDMVGVAQLVEHPVVVRDVAGSSPVAHPITLGKGTLPFCFFFELLSASINSWNYLCTLDFAEHEPSIPFQVLSPRVDTLL